LSDHSRDVCTSETTYDARWSGDPLVVGWRRTRRESSETRSL
jgi:hypothetical protein